MDTAIKFFAIDGRFGAFSNFSSNPVTFLVRGKHVTFPTSEHAFQAMKFINDIEHFDAILNAPTPKDALHLGTKKLPIENLIKWEKNRDNVMYEIVRAKFAQHLELCTLLLSTGNNTLMYTSPYDGYWGWGCYRTGGNMLGKILMRVRDELRVKI